MTKKYDFGISQFLMILQSLPTVCTVLVLDEMCKAHPLLTYIMTTRALGRNN